MSYPIGFPNAFATDTLTGGEALPVQRSSGPTIVTTTGAVATLGDDVSTAGSILLTTDAGASSSTAYVATGALAASAGRSFWFTPSVTCGATPTLAINGGTARPLRTETGTALVAGMLRGGVEYLIRFTSGNIFNVLGVRLVHQFQSRVQMVGSSATFDGYATDGGSVVARLGGFGDGNITAFVNNGSGGLTTAFYAYGAGNTHGRPTGELRAFGSVRVEGNLTVVGTITGSTEADIDNPPASDSLIQLMEELGGTGAYETLQQARVVTTTEPFQITPSDFGRNVRCNINGAFIDCGDMPDGSTTLINVQTGGTVSIYTGEAVDFTDRTEPQVRVSKGRYRVHRGNGNEWEIEAVNGKTITDADLATYPLPTYNRRIAIVGYSNGIRTMKNIAGWRDQFLAWGEDPSVVNIVSGVGASSFLKGGESDYPNNHWWDWENSLPGPNVTTFMDAVAAQPSSPDMEFCIVHIGYADLNLWEASRNPLSAALTEAQMVEHWADCLEYIRGESGLNLPDLKFVICPMAQRHVGVWPEYLWYAQRRMMLQLCADHPTLAVRGPDSFDLRYIANDSHPTIRSQAIFSGRWARWTETIAERKSCYLGPEISDFIRDSSTSCRVVIDSGLNDTYADGSPEGMMFPGRWGDWTNAPLPTGLALLGDGDSYITDNPVEISNVRWSYSSGTGLYTITLTHADTADVRLCWPYGFMYRCGEDPSMCIRSNTTGEPLATYHPDVPLPKYFP